uniref:Uncharacterized protein n=1 Tax=Amphimedon queenslandica TaxID=400682 RepID=A0A1X7VHM4_AMPQE
MGYTSVAYHPYHLVNPSPWALCNGRNQEDWEGKLTNPSWQKPARMGPSFWELKHLSTRREKSSEMP